MKKITFLEFWIDFSNSLKIKLLIIFGSSRWPTFNAHKNWKLQNDNM